MSSASLGSGLADSRGAEMMVGSKGLAFLRIDSG